MEKENFIQHLKKTVRDSAINSSFKTITNPPGRSPAQDLVELSMWFNALAESDKKMVKKAAQMTLDQGIFNFLCILDGVGLLGEDYRDGDFILSFRRRGEEEIINSKQNDLEELHDIYNALTLDEESG
ncbi:MAG TPA: hypothetical protein VJ810_03185 [Blastocatellia bacterium]|nr:hypothetical protein [Blastocatellia bacterium]